MKRITKKVREEAALICAIAASTPELSDSYGKVLRRLHGEGSREAHIGYPPYKLALAAWDRTWSADASDAEAEALLRSGWSPSDGAP